MTIAWVYLFIASCFEVCWIYSLKVLDMKKIAQISPSTIFSDIKHWEALLPLLGYIAFGLGNIYFFSQSMKTIPASTAFAVWMGLALIFSKAVGILVFKEAFNTQQLVFTAIVLVGIIGLKWFE
jgi:quaternary ammonium compound-resistance protein SugE